MATCMYQCDWMSIDHQSESRLRDGRASRTLSFVSVFWASRTVPKDPSPSVFRTLYRFIYNDLWNLISNVSEVGVGQCVFAPQNLLRIAERNTCRRFTHARQNFGRLLLCDEVWLQCYFYSPGYPMIKIIIDLPFVFEVSKTLEVKMYIWTWNFKPLENEWLQNSSSSSYIHLSLNFVRLRW